MVILFYVLGGLSAVGGFASTFAAFAGASDGGEAGLAAIIGLAGSVFLFGFGYALRKLEQIEMALRR